MSSNPFALRKDYLPQGVQETQSTTSTQNTKEAREAKEKEQLQNTDVLNNGSRATTDGVFENYDGFTFTGSTSAVKSGKSTSGDNDSKKLMAKGKKAGTAAKEATKNAKGAKQESEKYGEQAIADQQTLTDYNVQNQQRTQQILQKVQQNNAQIKTKESENAKLVADTNKIEQEIATLMQEDGQDYTAQTFNAGMFNAAPQQAQQGAQQGVAQESPMSGFSVCGNKNGAQPFAMLSLPAPKAAPSLTSETAVAAYNNQNNQAQGTQSQPTQSSQNSKQKGAQVAASLNKFGQNLTTTGGKNADKINELMRKSSSNQSKMQSNRTTIGSLNNQNQSLVTSGIKFLSVLQNSTTGIQESNQAGQQQSHVAQDIGNYTSMAGGIASATGGVMMCFAPTAAAGAIVMAAGGAASAAGATTTQIANATQTKTTDALAGAVTTLGQLGTSASQLADAIGVGKKPEQPKSPQQNTSS